MPSNPPLSPPFDSPSNPPFDPPLRPPPSSPFPDIFFDVTSLLNDSFRIDSESVNISEPKIALAPASPASPPLEFDIPPENNKSNIYIFFIIIISGITLLCLLSNKCVMRLLFSCFFDNIINKNFKNRNSKLSNTQICPS